MESQEKQFSQEGFRISEKSGQPAESICTCLHDRLTNTEQRTPCFQTRHWVRFCKAPHAGVSQGVAKMADCVSGPPHRDWSDVVRSKKQVIGEKRVRESEKVRESQPVEGAFICLQVHAAESRQPSI